MTIEMMKMRTPLECLEDLRALRDRYGYSAFDEAVRTLNRERLANPTREERKKFPPKLYQRLYDCQKGICRFCGTHLDVPAKKNEIDHIDPNRQDLNSSSNLQLLHITCNRVKSCRTVYEQSKHTGKSISEILTPVIDDAEVR